MFVWDRRREEADRDADHDAHDEEEHSKVQVVEVLDDAGAAVECLISARHRLVYVLPDKAHHADQKSYKQWSYSYSYKYLNRLNLRVR